MNVDPPSPPPQPHPFSLFVQCANVNRRGPLPCSCIGTCRGSGFSFCPEHCLLTADKQSRSLDLCASLFLFPWFFVIVVGFFLSWPCAISRDPVCSVPVVSRAKTLCRWGEERARTPAGCKKQTRHVPKRCCRWGHLFYFMSVQVEENLVLLPISKI